MSVFLQLAQRLHQWNGAFCVMLLGIVFCAQILVVVLRYLFNIGFIELQDLVTYCFAMLCILAVPNALRTNDHVRVDIFRAHQSPARARRVDQLAIGFFLLPVFVLALWFALPLVSYSWSIFEGSRETGGLPGFFIVLTALPVACVLILVQGLAIAVDKDLIHGPNPQP